MQAAQSTLPGVYRGVVVEVRVAHVLVTAVDKEGEIAEAEGLGSTLD